MRKQVIRNLILFGLIALSIGWVGVWVDSLIPTQDEEESLGMAVWLITPLIAVFVFRTFMGDGWKNAGLSPNFLENLSWYLIAFIIFPLVTITTMLLGGAWGWISFEGFNTYEYFRIFAGLLVINIIKNVFEESVWRGYLTAQLIRLQLSDFQIYLIAGLIWGLWHAPYYMVFLSEDMLSVVLPVDKFTFFLVALISMVVWTVMFTELFRITGSIWPVILLHAVEDAVINHLVIDGFIKISEGMEIWISPICGIIPTLLYLFIGIWLRKQRKMIGTSKILAL